MAHAIFSIVFFIRNEISHGLACWRHTEMEPWITRKIVKARKKLEAKLFNFALTKGQQS